MAPVYCWTVVYKSLTMAYASAVCRSSSAAPDLAVGAASEVVKTAEKANMLVKNCMLN